MRQMGSGLSPIGLTTQQQVMKGHSLKHHQCIPAEVACDRYKLPVGRAAISFWFWRCFPDIDWNEDTVEMPRVLAADITNVEC